MHECPRCKHIQIPRIDINLASNAIELDPNNTALYGEGIEETGESSGDGFENNDEYFTDTDENDDEDISNNNMNNNNKNSEMEGEEEEEKLFDSEGLLSKEDAAKLLVLMNHARTCGQEMHASSRHAEVCKSTKFLMLHIRDCRGVDLHGRDCLLPWCAPCRKMLKHLSQCPEPEGCPVCSPW